MFFVHIQLCIQFSQPCRFLCQFFFLRKGLFHFCLCRRLLLQQILQSVFCIGNAFVKTGQQVVQSGDIAVRVGTKCHRINRLAFQHRLLLVPDRLIAHRKLKAAVLAQHNRLCVGKFFCRQNQPFTGSLFVIEHHALDGHPAEVFLVLRMDRSRFRIGFQCGNMRSLLLNICRELRQQFVFQTIFLALMDDMKYADQVRFIRRTMWKEPEHITCYTIFTTTDCNARCFYCYEMGRSRIPMSNETAHKAAAYIAAHCGGEKVHLHWFGGEPLFNKQVIDIICTDLAEKGIVYESMMISNGYLFDGATVEQAVSHWKLKSVQITLDGTEEIYNRSKAFIYKDGKSPYQVVLANIQRLLDAGVSVHIRLNMDEHNADNLMELADELHERFGGKGKFSVYSHTLFEFAGSKTHIRAQEERRQLYQKQQRLRKKLDDCGIGASYYLRQKLRIRQCMADSGGSLTILPNGELGLCEHYSEDNFVGSLDGKASERSVIQSFREYWEPIEECKTCFYYPECIRLKKCAELKECFEELRAEYKEYLLKSMQKTYNAWLKKEQIDEEEPHPDC